MFNSTSVSKTEIAKVFNQLKIDVPHLKKANYSSIEAAELVFSEVNSITLPLTSTVYLDLIIKNIETEITKSGNYSKNNILALIQVEWSKVEKELHYTPVYRKAVKEWIKMFYSSMSIQEFYKLKDIKSEAYILAIKALLPLL